MHTIGMLAGGVGLFLLGMTLMTDGLKHAAGPALERILARSTRTRVRGLASGILFTAVVQSSSAVTVATIGFVNAGLLGLGGALWVLFGANVGTTMTGWLVALIGLEVEIEALALPLIGIGMILKLTGENSRRGAIGLALAGFGVLFLGIDLLKDGFAGLADDFTPPAGEQFSDRLWQVLIGVALTVLMQSSSASLAVALTAAQEGLLTTTGAAAVAIGANIGTTVTALIAALGATPNAKRAASAHILFNLLTGLVAFFILSWLVAAIAWLSATLALEATPAMQLAFFHTLFNVLGVIMIWPLAGRLTRFLEARFKRAEEDAAQPRYLDRTVLAVPTLALSALERELRHLGTHAHAVLRAACAAAQIPPEQRYPVDRLARSIADFIVAVNRVGMPAASAQRLPALLRVARYYDAATDLAVEASAARHETDVDADALAQETEFLRQAERLLIAADPVVVPDDPRVIDAVTLDFDVAYQALKAELLAAGASARLSVSAMDARLRAASALHRSLEQAGKAARLLDSLRQEREAVAQAYR